MMKFSKPVKETVSVIGAATLALSMTACGEDKKGDALAPVESTSTATETNTETATAEPTESKDPEKKPDESEKPDPGGDKGPENEGYDGNQPSGNNPDEGNLSKPQEVTLKGNSDNDGPEMQRFVANYAETLNYAAATGDVSSLRKMSSEECQTCTLFADRIVMMHKEGKYVKAVPEYKDTNVKFDNSDPKDPKVTYYFTTTGSAIVSPDGKEEEIPPRKHAYTVSFGPDGETYKIKYLKTGE